MLISVPREQFKDETRVPLLPSAVERLVQKGASVGVETGLGLSINIDDDAYKKAGAVIEKERSKLIASADCIVRIRKPDAEEIKTMKKGAIHISYLDPFNESALVDICAKSGISAISLEMIPRTTLAQKMDVLSSQANIAGYAAVIIAAERINKVFPMMITPSGTISPARVFIIGAGVAGLQAIATAKRLGARVEAFDTRPAVAEQVQSLGAKFVKVDLGETGETKNGYAKQLTQEQLDKQRQAMAKQCSLADVVITTAQVFGKKAPLIVTKDMIAGIKPGSVIVDLAVETGGNVEGSVAGKEVDINGVKIIGITNMPGQTAFDASLMFSNNICNFIDHFWNKEAKSININTADEIMQGCLITHNGSMCNKTLLSLNK
ncbi:MAG: Re/Si-specific NAD(P)(+) transhydrogenase subunit alpha [Candidatus Auribacter fodinae]|jgi:NAD(P) transhydrogenase subunit alpha|uniref:proton-translocating NAD(P)(+) transhydrogenase n=1 Tax=Candidatus Auribacter fodinae TaxID=2093366 RepID=A0A3A4R707_9BACT|nr:MAG: Re/Si-specific NAD(P)(+) transhydrogenase subunit alpha [Candidatus Auribacter fodinae]